MRSRFLIIFLFASLCMSAQQVETPLIVAKIKSNQSYKVQGQLVEIIEVIEDSRCPSDVTCVWEGQARVKVRVQQTDGSYTDKELLFKGARLGNENEHQILKSNESILIARQLLPYPVSTDQGKLDYVLEVFEKPIRKN